MRKIIYRSIVALLLVVCGMSIGLSVCQIAVAGGVERPVLLNARSVSTEVCVLVVHRSQIHNQKPVARCATPSELRDLVK